MEFFFFEQRMRVEKFQLKKVKALLNMKRLSHYFIDGNKWFCCLWHLNHDIRTEISVRSIRRSKVQKRQRKNGLPDSSFPLIAFYARYKKKITFHFDLTELIHSIMWITFIPIYTTKFLV